MALIDFQNINKTYRVKEKLTGPFAGLRGFFSQKYKHVEAVKDISFEVAKGELVGYLGPNGAGKSTTIKILTGILVPSSGTVMVGGLVPYKHRSRNALNIGAVFGQRTQLWWDLPVSDSYELNRKLYGIPKDVYKNNLEKALEYLEVKEFFDTPVRQLSLGQKMRAEIGAALLHDPAILFLDEPTIGLDVLAKDKIRKYIRLLNKEKGTTVLLTTHDMTDVEEICDRIIIIDLGRKLYDGRLSDIKAAYQTQRTLIVDLADEKRPEIPGMSLLKSEGFRHWLAFDRTGLSTTEAINRVSSLHAVKDLAIQDVELEAIIRDIYGAKSVRETGPAADA